MSRPRLVPPSVELVPSYRALVREFLDAGERPIPFVLKLPNDDAVELIATFDACRRGEGLPPGRVPHSTFWLVVDDEVVGVSNVRHELTEKARRDGGNVGYGVRPSARRNGYATILLRETLERMRKLEIHEAWLTCVRENVASRRTIEKCGGELVSEEYLEEHGDVLMRFRIDLGP